MSMITAIAQGRVDRAATTSAGLPHVLLVLDQIPKALGGGERIVLRLASLLPMYGYRVSILAFAADRESPALKFPPCTIYLLPLQRTYDLTALRAARELRQFIDRERVEIVQTFFESSDLWGGFIVSTTDAKLIWSRRDMGILRGPKHEIAYRCMAGIPDAVFAVSEQVRRHCVDVDGVDPEKVHTVYNGLDLAKWWAADRPVKNVGEPLIVTTVGNIRRVKGHDVLIEAAAVVAQDYPAVKFTVGGDVLESDYFAELHSLVAARNLQGLFEFVGPVNNLQEHLSKADIFVLPSRSEGFSNAIIEAMAASLPVVATDVGGNAEAVRQGVSGYIVPAEDADALANAMGRLLADPVHARAMGAAGRKLVKEQFTTEAMMDRVTSVYAGLLGRGDSPNREAGY